MTDNFIDVGDYVASVHKEILSSLIRRENSAGVPNPDFDPEVIEVCEDRAVDEMRGYLEKSYDVEAIGWISVWCQLGMATTDGSMR